MPSDSQAVVGRFEVFLKEAIAPAVIADREPLEVGVWQCAEPVPFEDAAAATYRPVALGFEWGPVWSTAWFRLRGRVPARMAGRAVGVRFSSDTEALLWVRGEPRQGLDVNRDYAGLLERAAGGEDVEVHVEAACNHLFGDRALQWDPPDVARRWNSPTPGRLDVAELCVLDEGARRLMRAYEFALDLLRALTTDAPRGRELVGVLTHVSTLLSRGGIAGAASEARAVLAAALERRPAASATLCHAVGHAHIDTAWLWPVRETKRKCMRTFSTVLRNMERYPEYRFLCSQAQQYQWIEERSPVLFGQIRARVAEGRWEAGGGMWVEPDCNCVSGESLVRQTLHADRYWRSRFGERGAQSFLYLPDTFGFSAALPQIMALAGLHTFVTNKLWWNESNEFPCTTFVWRGIDGTEVLGHNTPGRDYNATNTPREMRRGESSHKNVESAGSLIAAGTPEARARWLQPFGFGDGGGGPTDWSIEFALRAAACDGLPVVRMTRADEFCAALLEDARVLREAGAPFPTLEGELYLELHRGTYTTQAWLKRANRRAEEGLRLAEALSWGGPAAPSDEEAQTLRAEQDAAWKLVLLNQFHDILPGSSIGWVYKDAAEEHHRVRETFEAHVRRGIERIAAGLDTSGLRDPYVVCNPSSVEQSGVADLDGVPAWIEGVPALGVKVVDRAACVAALPATGPAEVVGWTEAAATLSNGVIEADVDAEGRVSRLRRVGGASVAARGAALNQLALYDDRPRMWDAWDIDAGYEDSPVALGGPSSGLRTRTRSGLRAEVELERPLGARSRLSMRIALDAGSPRLDVRVRVEWREERRLLRVLFPTCVRADRATYEIQFGHVSRSTRRNTSVERAMFEVPAQRWMDLSMPGLGLALLNDSKYGHSCHAGVMGLTLLRSPKYPDPAADMGVHEFAYSLMPHDGDWRGAGVEREAERLNMGLRTSRAPAGDGSLGRTWAPVAVTSEGSASASIAALKCGDDDGMLVLRLVETHGGAGMARVRWNVPVARVESLDLLERPRPERIAHDTATCTTSVELRPFQIVTLGATRAMA